MNNQEENTKLTSVKIIKDLYSQFKRVTLDEKLTLQQLVNRSVNLYVSDNSFRRNVNDYKELQLVSGSKF